MRKYFRSILALVLFSCIHYAWINIFVSFAPSVNVLIYYLISFGILSALMLSVTVFRAIFMRRKVCRFLFGIFIGIVASQICLMASDGDVWRYIQIMIKGFSRRPTITAIFVLFFQLFLCGGIVFGWLYIEIIYGVACLVQPSKKDWMFFPFQTE